MDNTQAARLVVILGNNIPEYRRLLLLLTQVYSRIVMVENIYFMLLYILYDTIYYCSVYSIALHTSCIGDARVVFYHP